MHFGKFNLAAAMFLSFSLSTFAQGYFPGSGEEEDENATSCVGDGCGLVFPNQEEQQASSEVSSDSDADQNQAENGTIVPDSTNAAIPADSAKVAKEEYADEDDEEDTRDRFVNETASEYAARKEGFTKTLQFGVRVGGGTNFMLGKKADGWNVGFEGNGGLTGRLPLYRRSLGLQMELDFSYRQYSYEKSTSYGYNKAKIDEMLFEIPVMLQYVLDDEGFFVNFGLNLGLKMAGESEFRQTIDTEDNQAKDKRSNTLPTVGVEFGAVVDLGFSITRWMNVDLRVVQNLNNFLDMDLIAESTIMGSKLYSLHTTLGISFLI